MRRRSREFLELKRFTSPLNHPRFKNAKQDSGHWNAIKLFIAANETRVQLIDGWLASEPVPKAARR